MFADNSTGTSKQMVDEPGFTLADSTPFVPGAFVCVEHHNEIIRYYFAKTEIGYTVQEISQDGRVLGQLLLETSQITITPLKGIEAFQFTAKSQDGSVEVDAAVAGMASHLVIRSPQINVNSPRLASAICSHES